MTENDLVFYMGGNVTFNNEIIANLTIDGPPLRFVLIINKEKSLYESREKAVNKIIDYLEKRND